MILNVGITGGMSSSVEGLFWVFSSDLIMSSTDGAVGWSSAESTMNVIQRVSNYLLCRIISMFGEWTVCLPDKLAVSRHFLRHYLGWSSARVNYRRAQVSCVTKDCRQNIAVMPCRIQKNTENKSRCADGSHSHFA